MTVQAQTNPVLIAIAARAPAGVTATFEAHEGGPDDVRFSTGLMVSWYVNETTDGWSWEMGEESGELEAIEDLDAMLAVEVKPESDRRNTMNHSAGDRVEQRLDPDQWGVVAGIEDGNEITGAAYRVEWGHNRVSGGGWKDYDLRADV